MELLIVAESKISDKAEQHKIDIQYHGLQQHLIEKVHPHDPNAQG